MDQRIMKLLTIHGILPFREDRETLNVEKKEEKNPLH